MDDKFGLKKKIENLRKMKRTLPIKIANQARNFFVGRWEDQAWDDRGKTPWERRKRETPKSEGKNILVSSGTLRRAVRNSIRDVSWDKIRLVVDLPYAKIHNDGGPGIAFGKHPFTMPRRRFMGQSLTLSKLQIDTIKQELAKI